MIANNDYRIDRTDTKRTPCGMNSIVFLSASEQEARAVFAGLQPGLDMWGRPCSKHGVVLSRWSYAEGDYIVLDAKFPVLQ